MHASLFPFPIRHLKRLPLSSRTRSGEISSFFFVILRKAMTKDLMRFLLVPLVRNDNLAIKLCVKTNVIARNAVTRQSRMYLIGFGLPHALSISLPHPLVFPAQAGILKICHLKRVSGEISWNSSSPPIN